jgi:hypothetical protein
MTCATPSETLEVQRQRSAISTAIAALAIVLAASYGCGSSSTTLTQPSTDRCAIGMPASPPTVGASGGSGTLNVTAARECVWTATSNATWLTISSGASGQGDGTVNYAVASNPAPAIRRGLVSVNSVRTEIVQSAAPCQFTLDPGGQSFNAAGGEGSVAVDTIDGCAWTATSGAPWIAITATENTGGPGVVRYRVEANTGDARAAAITIGGQTFAIAQAGPSAPPQCNIGIEPSTFTAPAEGGTATIAVSAASSCAWIASTQTPWITIASGASGRGNGTVNVRFAQNVGALRVGTVAIANQIYTVTQAASLVCTSTIAPTSTSAPAAASTASVAVTLPNGCAWTATSQATWVSITNGASGNGNGTVGLAIAANPNGTARSGSATIAGQTFTVNQAAAACTFTIAPNQISPPSAGGNASVAVTAPNGCAWTAASQTPWITITSGGNGSGNGTVNLTVAANPGAARAGTATIAGQTFTVNQAAAPPPCTYAIAPLEQAVPFTGGPVVVTVTTQPGCVWTAVSQTQWIVVDRGASGTGDGTVEMTVGRNVGAARVGTVAIAGQVFTVNQGAEPPPCTYAFDPAAQAVPVLGGDFAVMLNTQAGCSWTITITAPWITLIDNPTNTGVGPAMIRYRVLPNLTGAPRVGTLETSGQVHTVTQAFP